MKAIVNNFAPRQKRRVQFPLNSVVSEVRFIETPEAAMKKILFYIPEDFIRFRKERNMERVEPEGGGVLQRPRKRTRSEERAPEAAIEGISAQSPAADTNRRKRRLRLTKKGAAKICIAAHAA
jgi:molybdenum cofactor biosynthesis enzyme MoaA